MNISSKIKLIRFIMWGYIFLFLIIIPLTIDYFVKNPISSERFSATEWSMLFVSLLVVSIFAVGVLQKFMASRLKENQPILHRALALYSYATFPSGSSAVLTIFLRLYDFSIFRLSSMSIFWICVFIFGSLSIYGIKQADRLVEKILFNHKIKEVDEK